MRQIGFSLFLLTMVSFSTGCGGGEAGNQKIAEPGKIALEDFGQMLKTLAAEGKKAPSKLAELEPVEPMSPVGAPALRNGEIVYLWGSRYLEGGTKLVAYEKQVPTNGGFVLLEDGSVKSVTVAEFGSLPKGK
jgi:hypothetical protein